MTIVLDFLSGFFIVAGAFFCLLGGIGLIRMPDFYTRMHAASVTETLGVGLVLLGLMLKAGLTLVAVKLFMMGMLIFFASPTASHALAHAALLSGLVPKQGPQGLEEEDGVIAETDVETAGEGGASSKP